MSTFKGIVAEFPDIRIDFFRQSSELNAKPPLACFLSHIHTDHLQGLEGSYNAPFIYCSAATKELLVKLQRKTHRLNLQKGLIETENCQYKDKKKLLKAIPLETPTQIELGPDQTVTVTLFDANHCVGAVMFLIEGNNKAILYTGDIRAEEWWVDYIARHPVMLPYTCGLKRLDNIYLDTSGVVSGCERYNSKREGVLLLLNKLSKYPKDTVFHLNAWTFGYEELWVSLASYFKSQIHLSPYHFKLFKSLNNVEQWASGPYLGGFMLGNAQQQAILTTNPDVKLHSCEINLGCRALHGPNVVFITPVIAFIDGVLYEEEGLDFGDLTNNADFSLHGQFQTLLDILGDDVSPAIQAMLVEASRSRKEAVPLLFDDEHGERNFTKAELLQMLKDAAIKKQQKTPRLQQPADFINDINWPGTESIKADNGELLPTWIRFPYARHSSLDELRNFVKAFQPKDVYQCVVNEETWAPEKSVQALFGRFCSGREFLHDREMMSVFTRRLAEQKALDSQQHKHLIAGPSRVTIQGDDERIARSVDEHDQTWTSRWKGPPASPLQECAAPAEHRVEATSAPKKKIEPTFATVHDQLPPPRPVSRSPSLFASAHRTSTPQSTLGVRLPDFGETSALPPTSLLPFGTRSSVISIEASRGLSSGPSSTTESKEYHPAGWSKRRKLDSLELNGSADSTMHENGRSKSGTDCYFHCVQATSARVLVDEAIGEEEEVAKDRVEDAVLATMGVDGMDWWVVELQSTRQVVNIGEEEEL
ncbi:hypothetical protein FN846DRAFT_949352 [Sphaerosporella brunnea]|uniref:Protein artemis n=1 Tax=Sphaerosporella brunnea TaxID=1250544 RepID=A0A5J5EWM7_9PEZI|nr:hypothetical protein FN846DRAFT_949352 [Sphaerosporella brunnea]